MSTFRTAFEDDQVEPIVPEEVVAETTTEPVSDHVVTTDADATAQLVDEAKVSEEDILWMTQVAKVCHAAIREFSRAVDNNTTTPVWEELGEGLKNSSIDGVLFHTNNPEATAADSHQNWVDYKAKNGWTFGEQKDEEAKTHPSMVPFDELSDSEKAKDDLFCSIVKIMNR